MNTDVDVNLEMSSALTFYTDSTDISPYMKNKANCSSSSADTQLTSDVRFHDVNSIDSEGYIVARKETENNKADPARVVDDVGSSSATSVNSSPTVLEVNCEDDGNTPVRVRRNSYTLENPSPALLLHLSQQDHCNGDEHSLSGDDKSVEDVFGTVEVTREHSSYVKQDLGKEKLSSLSYLGVDGEKQRHLKRYLEQLSSVHLSHQFSSLYFPSINEEKASAVSVSQRDRQSTWFPDIHVEEDGGAPDKISNVMTGSEEVRENNLSASSERLDDTKTMSHSVR